MVGMDIMPRVFQLPEVGNKGNIYQVLGRLLLAWNDKLSKRPRNTKGLFSFFLIIYSFIY